MEAQLRMEITQIILKLPERRLQSVLDFLKLLEKNTSEQIETAEFVSQIFEEDARLLKRLAQ